MVIEFEGYLYHVVRYEKLNIGQKLHFGGKPNFFSRKINSIDFSVNEKDINALILSKDIDKLTEDESKKLKQYVYHSCLVIRELVLENIRLKEYTNHPSRLECLYCVESIEDARKWIEPLKRMDRHNPPLQIVKLKAKGKLFKGDGNLMLRNTFSIDSKIEMAHKYWNAETNSDNEELLFIGDVEVVKIFEDLEI